jgi:hypothetical protein
MSDIVIEWRWAGRVDKLPSELAAKLVRMNVDVMLAPRGAKLLPIGRLDRMAL